MYKILFFLIIPLSLSAQQFTTRHKMNLLEKQKMTRQLSGGTRVVADSMKQNLPVFTHSYPLKITALPPGIPARMKTSGFSKIEYPVFFKANPLAPGTWQFYADENVARTDSLNPGNISFWKVRVKCGPAPEKPRARSLPAQ